MHPLASAREKMRLWPTALTATLALRIGAGAAGTLPPVAALAFFDRAAYGQAMANFALALLLIGPIAQYLSQGYLRELVAADTRDGPPTGAITAPLYALLCIGLLAALAATSLLTAIDAAFAAGIVAIMTAARLQESWFVAAGRQSAAIALFYLIPPLVLVGLMLGLHGIAGGNDFLLVGWAQVAAYGGCVLASLVIQPAHGRGILVPRIPSSLAAWRRELSAAGLFLANGAMLSATENLPIVLLKFFGFAAVTPSYELARKVAAVPGVVLHALNMHLAPRLISAAHAGAWQDFRAQLVRFSLITSSTGIAYIALALAVLFGLVFWLPAIAPRIEVPVFVILLAAAAVTAIAAPCGSALIALRGEAWWTVGAALSLAIQLVISAAAARGAGMIAIPLAALAQTAALSAVVVLGTLALLRRRRPRDDLQLKPADVGLGG
ncbi:MAG: hypothetical protein R3D62_03350 [Xanthobacteraceae bacterium]